MTQRFQKAYDALYNGFMNGTLAAGDCKACAVGNIVAHNIGAKIKITNNYDIYCDKDNQFWFLPTLSRSDYAENKALVLKVTGYDIFEIEKIENAFESNCRYYFTKYHDLTEHEIMEDQFKGLMAVMDVLIELDEVKRGEEYKETFKKKFQPKAELV